ncbi:transposase [Stieleria varia]|uniref:Transposase n=1 Tax=Stieleria varia TaxID=2528005 RepID=A0A5C6AGQ0_9BACT|nr:transposase [Stieleria varia]TWT98576.1 Transposase [Stieleria varia]
MAKKAKTRRVYDEDFKRDAVQMLLDGHSAKSVAERLGISCPTIIRRWKTQQLAEAGPVADVMDARVKELENELRRVERERDVLKKALIIFGRNE